MIKPRLMLVLAGVCLLAATCLQAETIHFREGGGSSYTDVDFDDTYARSAYSSTTYGTSYTIEVSSDSDRIGLIAIKDLFTELPVTSGGCNIQINSATLHLTRYNQGSSSDTVKVYPVTTNWLVDSAGANENDVSWEHLEQSQSTDWASGDISTSDYDTSVCETGSWVSNYNEACEIEITDVIAEIYADEINYGLAVTATGFITMRSSENGTASRQPSVEISYEYVGGTTYTLTVNSGTGDGSYAEDAVADIDADAAPSGQDFDEWVGDTSGIASVSSSSTTLTMPAANQEITATYTDLPMYSLTVNSGTGDGSYSESTQVDITAGTAPSGQDFDEWVGDTAGIASVTSSSTTLTMPAADQEITATYTDKTWTLTVNSGTGDGSYVVATVVDITADTAPSGQDFVAWTGDTSGIASTTSASTTITMPYGAAEVTATYTDKTWTLTVNSGTGDGSYVVATVVDIDADAAASGKQFDEWVGDTEGIASPTSASTTLTMPYADAEITATYEDIPTGYTLTVNSGSGDGSYSESHVVDITADAAASGKFFDAWIGDTANVADINDPTTTLTMPAANQEITATYADVVSGLVSRFTFDMDARDTYGSNDGTLTGGASVTNDGTRGGVLSLDGDNDYVSLPSNAMAAGRSELTLSMWVKPDTWASGDTIYDEYGESNYWQFTVINGSFYTRDSSTGTTGSRNNDISMPSLSTGSWQHVAFVYSVSAGKKEIWYDGAVDGTSTTSIDTLTSDRDGVGIGYACDGNNFDGLVDDVRLYNRALNTTEIAYLAEQTLYTLTVNSGSGDGNYAASTVVDITADSAPSGYVFDDWVGDTSNIADVDDPTTTITMPAADAEITATYDAATTYTLTVNSGSGDGNYAASAVVDIDADSPPSGQQFDQWVGNTSGIANVNAASTTLTMPASNQTITATYEDIPAGDPSISSVSDSTPSHEQSITISGGNFGSQGGSLLAWDDFEDQQDGSIILGADTKDGSCSTWATQYGYSGLGLKFDDAHVHAGNLAAKVDWSVDEYSIRAFGLNFSATDQIYLSYWRYMDGNYTTSDPTCNHKQFYLFGNNGNFPMGMPLMPAGTSTWGFYINNSTPQPDWNGTNNINTQGWTYYNTDDVYQRWEFYCKLNDPWTAYNGVLTYWKDGVIGRHRTDYRHRFVDGEYVQWFLGHMAQEFTDTAKAWFDDVYAATTQARVELGNSSTFTSCTHREIQIPTSWSSSSITIDFNQGNFGSGTVYLFVVDADGDASAGYAVTTN